MVVLRNENETESSLGRHVDVVILIYHLLNLFELVVIGYLSYMFEILVGLEQTIEEIWILIIFHLGSDTHRAVTPSP
jgi:hypothetical protein